MAEASSFRIRLTGKHPTSKDSNKQQRHVVTVTPSMTIHDLTKSCYELFGVSVPSSKNKNHSKRKRKRYDVQFWVGFPPKKLDVNQYGAQVEEGCLVSKWIHSGDNVMCKFEEVDGNGPTDSNDNHDASKTSLSAKATDQSGFDTQAKEAKGDESCSVKTRPKRASAMAATASFAENIRAQEEFLNNEKRNKSKKPRKTSRSAVNKSVTSSAQAAKRKAAAEARAAAANSRRLASLPGGRALDGSSVPDHSGSSSTHSKSSKRARSIMSGMGSEDDVSATLLASINSSNGKVISNVLRSAMRNAVGKTYEASRAVVRNSAITSNRIAFTSKESSPVTQGSDSLLGCHVVKYPKGIEGRGFYEETVDIIAMEALKAVVSSVHADFEESDSNEVQGGGGREMLRPRNMAQLSPRVFWSLWFHFKDHCSSIEEALRILLPDLDWCFLDSRSRELSVKAKENVRQQKIGDGDDNERKRDREYERGREVAEAVEEAMEQMYEHDAKASRDRAAKAAMARMAGLSGSEIKEDSNWCLETPSEEDEDELLECVQTGFNSIYDASIEKGVASYWVSLIISNCKIRNWRELANKEADEIYPLLIEELSHSDSSAEISEQVIEACIEYAQLRTIDEVMLQILDGDQDAFEILRDEGRSGTPKDLCLWLRVPSMLLDEVVRLKENYSIADVAKWTKRAEKAVETLEWFKWYSTPI